jgi:hypothetical protein
VVADFADGSGRLLGEAKVDKPDEALWDALKLADISRIVPGIHGAYLIYAAKEQRWTPGIDGAALFLTGSTRAWGAREMIERWPRAWAGLLRGGRGIRPLDQR